VLCEVPTPLLKFALRNTLELAWSLSLRHSGPFNEAGVNVGNRRNSRLSQPDR